LYLCIVDFQVKESDIVDLLDTIRTSIYATPIVNEYLLTAFIKLTTRLQQPAQINRVRNILSQSTSNLNVELQQRAVEYGNLFEFDEIRKGVVERMPAPEIREENRVLGEAAPKKGKASRKSVQVKQSASKDLLNILGGEEEVTSSTVFGGKEKNAELLQDLFGPSSSGPSANGAGVNQSARSNVSDIMGLFGTPGAGVSPAVAPAPALSMGGGSMQGLEDMFGRREATSPPQTQTYCNSTALGISNLSSYRGLLQE
jgi:AP-1 complex subunit gamma-1